MKNVNGSAQLGVHGTSNQVLVHLFAVLSMYFSNRLVCADAGAQAGMSPAAWQRLIFSLDVRAACEPCPPLFAAVRSREQRLLLGVLDSPLRSALEQIHQDPLFVSWNQMWQDRTWIDREVLIALQLIDASYSHSGCTYRSLLLTKDNEHRPLV